MAQFKKGDRVRVVRETYPGGPQVGDIGTVLSNDSRGVTTPIAVIWSNGRRQSGFRSDEIELNDNSHI